MAKKQTHAEDLSTTQEHVIAFIVIVLFGLLYWFFMHGDDKNSVADTETAAPTVISDNSNASKISENTAEFQSNKNDDEDRQESVNSTVQTKTATQKTTLLASSDESKGLMVKSFEDLESKLAVETALKQEALKKLEREKNERIDAEQKVLELTGKGTKNNEIATYKIENAQQLLEVERAKAEVVANKLKEVEALATAERTKAEETAKKLAEAEKIAKKESLKAAENAAKLDEAKQLAAAERLKAKQTEAQLAEFKELKSIQAALDADSAERLKASIEEAKRLEAEEAAKKVELANKLAEAERVKAAEIAKKLESVRKAAEAERQKAEATAKKLAEVKRLKAAEQARRIEEEKQRKLAEAERLKAEQQLAEAKRLKEEAAIAKEDAVAKEKTEQSEISNELQKRIELAQATLEAEQIESLDLNFISQNEDKPKGFSFEDKLKKIIDTKHTKHAVTLDKIQFATGSATLNSQSFAQIESVASILKRYEDIKILIRGHTDNTGNEEKNMSLSLSRSMQIKNRLVSLGVDPEIINIEGIGSQAPIADNTTEEGRRENRRIDLLLLK